MQCATYREALSARLDGEDEPIPPELLEAHLRGCAGCRAFADRAVSIRRSMTIRVAQQVPDLTGRIMAAAPPRKRERWAARSALGVVAVAQLTLALAQLFGVADGLHGPHSGFMTGHLSNESVAWNAALGVGMGWAALRSRAAAAQLPLFAGFVLVLTVVSVGDLVSGQVTWERLASHALVVLGLAMLLVVRRQAIDPTPLPGEALADGQRLDTSTQDEAGGRPPRRRGGEHRPASKHRAA